MKEAFFISIFNFSLGNGGLKIYIPCYRRGLIVELTSASLFSSKL